MIGHGTAQYEVCVQFVDGTFKWLTGPVCELRFTRGIHLIYLVELAKTHKVDGTVYSPHTRTEDCHECHPVPNANNSSSGGSSGQYDAEPTFDMRNARSGGVWSG